MSAVIVDTVPLQLHRSFLKGMNLRMVEVVWIGLSWLSIRINGGLL
jgi:hypothetical protein